MRLHRLRVNGFAGIANVDVAFGPGLNVLYGPNDLGKSTLADAIRLALLLPHSSSHAEQYAPWHGGQRPEVELDFETDAQRIWRVRKQFSKSGGFSILEESRDGIDFSEVEKGRKVDGRIRELLRWGIPEPGGSGGAKGLPDSFLATVLLSTQSDVAAVLRESLEEDPTGTGKERIAAALQAVAQDPLFVSLLGRTQARRDEAYTEKGAKKASKDSPFRAAAERVRQLREERDRCQKLVDESESVERELRELTGRRSDLEERVAVEAERLATLHRQAKETADLLTADEHLQQAAQLLKRIQDLDRDIGSARKRMDDLDERRRAAEQALKAAQEKLGVATEAFDAARRGVESLSVESATSATVERQTLELRLASVDRAAIEAGNRLQSAAAALKKVDEAAAAETARRQCSDELARAETMLSQALTEEKTTQGALERLGLLDRVLALRNARAEVAFADGDVEREDAVRARADALSAECRLLDDQRAGFDLPSDDDIASMRRLENELAGARGALNVGLVITIDPVQPLTARISKDGSTPEGSILKQSIEVEADTSLDIELPDVATVRVRGGRRGAQKAAIALQQRWATEVIPRLGRAGVSTLAELDHRITAGRALENSLAAKRAELGTLQEQVAISGRAAEARKQAAEKLDACSAAIGDIPIDPLLVELALFGEDAAAGLRKEKERRAFALDGLRKKLIEARSSRDVANDRLHTSKAAQDAADAAAKAALQEFPSGAAQAQAEAQASLAAAGKDRKETEEKLKTLDERIASDLVKAQAALTAAEGIVARARAAAGVAEQSLTDAVSAHSIEVGRLQELERARAVEDFAAAEKALNAASHRRAALPVPERAVGMDEIQPAQQAVDRARAELATIERETQKAHGALEQVGGGVARERLKDVIEASDLAERHERDVEADCEAWKLLLEQMKEADAEQASNLGQVLGPAIATRFEALTDKRYEGVRISADLTTQGVLVRGNVRPTDRISVGTREQLSTLYRLSLAEYLGSTVVLDDQLVQSDNTRMDWFRALLMDKAGAYQVIVFTCRPDDYLSPNGTSIASGPHSLDSADGLVRAVNLGHAIQRA